MVAGRLVHGNHVFGRTLDNVIAWSKNVIPAWAELIDAKLDFVDDITQMAHDPSRFDTNAIDLPSGDQVGKPSWAGFWVSRCGAPPFISRLYISQLPSRSDI